MHLRTISGLIAGAATLALTTTVLAVPAQAAKPSPTVSRAAVAKFVESHGTGRIAAADVDFDSFVRDLQTIGDTVCERNGVPATSSLVLLDIAETPGVAAVTVALDVNTNDDPAYLDETCTFSMLLPDEGLTFNGRYTFDVSSPLDPVTRRTANLSGDFALTQPVFTNVDEYATATLSATGKTLRPTSGWVNTKVTKAKTASQKKAAKKKYQAAVKAAKKKYAKAGKTKKAKKAMTKSIARAQKTYKKAIAPTTRTVKQRKNYNIETPFTLSALLNGYDDIRP